MRALGNWTIFSLLWGTDRESKPYRFGKSNPEKSDRLFMERPAAFDLRLSIRKTLFGIKSAE
jgi:hypothetical protein